MKKIIISITLVMFAVVMLFATAEYMNNIDDAIDSNIDNNDILKKIELSDYYGFSSLLINLHLEIGRGVSDEDGIFYVVDLLSQIKYYSDLDIIDYLGYTFDIEQSLSSILLEISALLDQIMSAKMGLENNLTMLEQKKIDCDDSKDISDKNFGLALKDLDSKNMEINLNKSLGYEQCAGDARIYYNVQDNMLGVLEFYYEVLENKYTYYSRNKSEIIQHYPEISYELSVGR